MDAGLFSGTAQLSNKNNTPMQTDSGKFEDSKTFIIKVLPLEGPPWRDGLLWAIMLLIQVRARGD